MSVSVEAQVTGRVLRVEKNVGDSVAEEDTLLILESMKMEIPVTSPEDGTLVEILTAEGEVVTEGTVVARIEV